MPKMAIADQLGENFRSHTAIAGFNIDSLDMAWAVIDAAEAANRPIFLQVTKETLDLMGWDRGIKALTDLLAMTNIPVSLHLDHAKDIDTIQRALDHGFTSVMFDGSALPLQDNINQTQKVVNLAKSYNALTEGEIGHVARDGESPEYNRHLTTVAEAVLFFNATSVDLLAIAIGTRHGTNIGPNTINLDRLVQIHEAMAVPLVLHGGSGISKSSEKEVISRGITKINIGTQLRKIWWSTINKNTQLKPREVLFDIRNEIRECSYGKIVRYGSTH